MAVSGHATCLLYSFSLPSRADLTSVAAIRINGNDADDAEEDHAIRPRTLSTHPSYRCSATR